MKRLMVIGAVVALGLQALAATYYVDANNGNDDWDGTAETPAADVATSRKGPKQTLAAITEVAKKSGDIIYAAPGVYNKGSAPNATYGASRVSVPAGVQLIAPKGPSVTTIEGKLQEGVANGCGSDSLRAVFLSGTSVVCGFTITKGRSSVAGDNGNGGAGRGGGLFVDCVFVDNGTQYRGAHLCGCTALRCYFGAVGPGDYMSYSGTKLVSCIVNTSRDLYSWCSSFNTTFVSGTHWDSTIANGKSYNCLFFNQPQCTLYNCYSTAAMRPTSLDADGQCRFSIAKANLGYDADTYRPVKGSLAIDNGNDAYFALATNGWSEAWQKYARVDYAGRPRHQGASIDIGAGEYDYDALYSKLLSPARVTVVESSADVHETSNGQVALPAGASLSLVWERADTAGDRLQDYSFVAAIPSDVTLKVYDGAATEPLWTLTDATAMPFVYQANAVQNLRFVAEGGEVVLSDFFDCGFVSIRDASTGLTVTGVAKGETVLAPGDAVTVRISRNFTTDFTVSGFMLNGTFVSFDDHADDWVWEQVVDGPASSIRAEAVYSTIHDWYVDPAGDDARDGRTKARAVKTLAAASALARTSGDIIHAAPGVYNEGVMAPVETSNSNFTSNRVVLAAGVGLVGAGADVTVIEGRRATYDADANGNGPDAVRCVYGRTGSYVKGFTLRGGATNKRFVDHDNTAGGGGLLYGAAIDCIVTNNVCAYRGGGANSAAFIRCRVSDNKSSGTGNDGNNCSYYGCVLSGSYYGSGDKYVNCTLLSAPGVNGAGLNVYNCVIDANVDKLFLHNCVCKGKVGANCTTNALCKVGVTAADLACDPETYRPLAGTAPVDAGDWDLYINNFPADYRQFALVDFAQGPRRIGQIDAGAGEYDWRTDPPTGLSISLSDVGDGTTELTVSRNFESEKPTLGFTFGGETVLFASLGQGQTWQTTLPTASVTDAMLAPIYQDVVTDWYVDAVNGNDANPGYLPDCPKHTLMGIVARARSGDIVHAAPGVYREGAKKDGDTMTRVVVPAGVGLVADGTGEAVIEGVISDGPGHSGADSVRCVSCANGAWVKGFTIRNGSTRVGSSNAYGDVGGGVNGGTAIDCVITNCYAVRGGGSASATLIRCVLKDCYTENGATNDKGEEANCAADGMYGGSAYDSWIIGATLNLSVVRNCRCSSLWSNNKASPVRAYNSYVDTGYQYVSLVNCVVRDKKDTFDVDEDTVSGKTFAADEDGRPVAGSTLAIDRGKAEYYVYPTAFAHEQGVSDLAGGPRVYNGTLDIGPGEYDWRGDFAKRLRRSSVSVQAASANVTTNDVAGLDLAAGDTLKFACVVKARGVVSFRVAGEGPVTVTYGESVLEPVDGVYSVRFDIDRNAPVQSEVFAVVNAGDGRVTVRDLQVPMNGTILVIR